MLITGIRNAISSELDIRRSAVFMKYLSYYLEMFALLGLLLPPVIVADYFLQPEIDEAVVTNKYYQVLDDINKVDYFFYTGTYRFVSDIIFYENTNISDNIFFNRTPIFNTVTSVSHQSQRVIYTCKPNNIYGWPMGVVGLTFICSAIYLIKTWIGKRKREYLKYDSIVNLGIINAILCVFIIVAALWHIPN